MSLFGRFLTRSPKSKFNGRGRKNISQTFERLEERAVMASSVAAIATGGTLNIYGADTQENIRIVGALNPGEFTVIGGTNHDSSSTLINGNRAIQTFTGIDKIVITFYGGDDQLVIENARDVDFDITTGDGDDSISIGKYLAIPIDIPQEPICVINDILQIDSGSGDDTIFIGRVFARNNDKYTTIIETKDGDDVVEFYNVSSFSVRCDGGSGDDQLSFGFTTVERSWVTRGAEGNDLINIYCSKTAQNTLIEGGFGNDTLAIDTIQADTDIVVSMDTRNYADTGNGDDTVLLARSVISGIQINVGEGRNNVTIGKYYDYDAENNLVLRDGGCVAERVLFNLDSYTDNTFVMMASMVTSFTYNGAGGNDSLDIRNNVFDAYYAYGGLYNSGGNDVLIRRFNSHTIAATAVGFIEE